MKNFFLGLFLALSLVLGACTTTPSGQVRNALLPVVLEAGAQPPAAEVNKAGMRGATGPYADRPDPSGGRRLLEQLGLPLNSHYFGWVMRAEDGREPRILTPLEVYARAYATIWPGGTMTPEMQAIVIIFHSEVERKLLAGHCRASEYAYLYRYDSRAASSRAGQFWLFCADLTTSVVRESSAWRPVWPTELARITNPSGNLFRDGRVPLTVATADGLQRVFVPPEDREEIRRQIGSGKVPEGCANTVVVNDGNGQPRVTCWLQRERRWWQPAGS